MYSVCFDFMDSQILVAHNVSFEVACEISNHEDYYYITKDCEDNFPF